MPGNDSSTPPQDGGSKPANASQERIWHDSAEGHKIIDDHGFTPGDIELLVKGGVEAFETLRKK